MRRVQVVVLLASVSLTGTATAASGAITAHDSAPGTFTEATFVNNVQVASWGEDVAMLAVDREGGLHVFGDDDGTVGVSYYSAMPGDTSFVADADVYPDPDAVAMTRSADGKAIDIAVADCRAVRIFQVPDDLRTLPSLASERKSMNGRCISDEITGPTPIAPLQMVALSDGRVVVIFDADPADKSHRAWTLYEGTPGGVFTRTILRGATPTMTTDLTGKHAYLAVRHGPDPLDIYSLAVSGTKWRRSPVTSLPAGSVAARRVTALSSVAASHDALVLSLSGHHTSIVIRRDHAGKWLPPKTLYGPNPESDFTLLAADPSAPSSQMWAATDNYLRPVTEARFTTTAGWSAPTAIDGPDISNGPGSTYYTLKAVAVGSDGTPYVEYSEYFYPS